MHPILIEGDRRFVQITQNALDFIATKSPEHYEMVTKYIGRIKHTHKGSGMLVEADPPTFVVNDIELNSPMCWYASDIVHDAYHSKLFHDYLTDHEYVPDHIYKGYDAEMKCLQIQKQFLITAGAAQRYINWIDYAPATRWWE
ncbi:MAG: hypothetical protein FWG40_07670 [Peptococcaceae bacterium]|nr:hypothetical protein [Peptococcaceae bacterium]